MRSGSELPVIGFWAPRRAPLPHPLEGVPSPTLQVPGLADRGCPHRPHTPGDQTMNSPSLSRCGRGGWGVSVSAE